MSLRAPLALLCLLSGAALAAAGEAELQAISRGLAPFATLKGRFEQSKTIRVLKKPLKSEGEFALRKDKGVLWRNAKPLPSTVRVRRDDIAQIKDGAAVVLVSLKEQPALGLIGKVLFAVFSADLKELERHFEFTRAVPPDAAGHWEAGLRPRDALIRKLVERIELGGGRVVDTVTLAEANGDSSVIRFKDVSINAPLSDEEEALLE